MANVPFLYPLKNIKKPEVCKWNVDLKWNKTQTKEQKELFFQSISFLFQMFTYRLCLSVKRNTKNLKNY